MNEAAEDPGVAAFKEGFRRVFESGEPPWDMMDENFVWDMSLVRWTERAEYVGREGFETFMRDWKSAWDDWRMEPIEFLPVGNQMVIVSRQTGKAKGSGVPVEMTYAQIWSGDPETMKATRARMFESRERAIATAEAEAEAASRSLGSQQAQPTQRSAPPRSRSRP